MPANRNEKSLARVHRCARDESDSTSAGEPCWGGVKGIGDKGGGNQRSGARAAPSCVGTRAGGGIDASCQRQGRARRRPPMSGRARCGPR
ncbi:hypothetical protein E2562_007908 [Oryza meyeriana var. granulata]|uniref:Uncharacterized protein n=1 Tax=Oryza meyeriana var. granulata TaxID=110450 RepID=A0A6G1DWZ6_9ORYZ|nr:hypothetical protein E2562_007908 [Oryza meyeriana var. granulata]